MYTSRIWLDRRLQIVIINYIVTSLVSVSKASTDDPPNEVAEGGRHSEDGFTKKMVASAIYRQLIYNDLYRA